MSAGEPDAGEPGTAGPGAGGPVAGEPGAPHTERTPVHNDDARGES